MLENITHFIVKYTAGFLAIAVMYAVLLGCLVSAASDPDHVNPDSSELAKLCWYAQSGDCFLKGD